MFGTVVKSPGTVNSFYCLHSLHSKCIFICVAVAVYLYLLSLQLELFSQRVQNNLIPLRHFSIPLLPFRLAHLQCDSSIFYRGFFLSFYFCFGFFILLRGFCQKRFLLSIFIESRRRVAHAERGAGRGRLLLYVCECVVHNSISYLFCCCFAVCVWAPAATQTANRGSAAASSVARSKAIKRMNQVQVRSVRAKGRASPCVCVRECVCMSVACVFLYDRAALIKNSGQFTNTTADTATDTFVQSQIQLQIQLHRHSYSYTATGRSGPINLIDMKWSHLAKSLGE